MGAPRLFQHKLIEKIKKKSAPVLCSTERKKQHSKEKKKGMTSAHFKKQWAQSPPTNRVMQEAKEGGLKIIRGTKKKFAREKSTISPGRK